MQIVRASFTSSSWAGLLPACAALSLTVALAAVSAYAQTPPKSKEPTAKKTQPSQPIPETYQPLNPTDVSCKMKVEDMWFSSNADGTRSIASAKITSLTCEDQDIELVSPQLKSGFLETVKYGNIQIGPPNDLYTARLSISVLPSQKKDLQKLKTSR